MIRVPPIDVLPVVLLAVLLGLAVWHDIRANRIPNSLILLGSIFGFLIHGLAAPTLGVMHVPGGQGLLFSLAGFAVGLLLLLPFYAMRTLGAGDVKLMALIGAFIGPASIVGAVLLTMLCGGVLALVVAAWSGQVAQVIGNLQQVLRSALLRGALGTNGLATQPAPVTGKLPYAVAIAGGTICHLVIAGSPAWQYFS